MATLPSPPDDLTPEQLYLGHLELIGQVAAHACRWRLGPEEAKDFAQHVHVKLIENDYSRIRQFQGRCHFKTYLTTVVQRLLLDYQNSMGKKWRPAAEAERQGPVAVLLDRLLHRDGLSYGEARQVLKTDYRVELSDAAMDAMRSRLPARGPRRLVGEEHLQAEPSRELRPDERLAAVDAARATQRVLAALSRALAKLAQDDLFLVRQRTRFKVADIARLRQVDQKPLYRRLEQIYTELRKALEREGVRRQDVKEVLDWLEPDLEAPSAERAKRSNNP